MFHGIFEAAQLSREEEGFDTVGKNCKL